MVKETVLERDGEIIEKLPAWIMRIKLKDVGTEIRCKLSGKMKQKHISVIPWDWVKIEVNQYDMTQGRIVYRYNNYDSNKSSIIEPDVEDLVKW
jgi:translation initiation factor IF-1